MGSGKWNTASYRAVSTTRKAMPRSAKFVQTAQGVAKQKYEAQNIIMRESRDSQDNPNSNAILIGLDVSSSMGFVAEALADECLGTFVEYMLTESPITDPQVCFSAYVDATISIKNSLQVTQFESDNRMSDQIVELYLAGGGGGNSYESTDLIWLFAAEKTSIDCFEKRGVKGTIITIGDEQFPKAPRKQTLKQLGFNTQMTTSKQFLEAAQEKYSVFHITMAEGNHCSSTTQRANVLLSWDRMLGKRHVVCYNKEYAAEIMHALIVLENGGNLQEILDSYQDEKCVESLQKTFTRQ